MSRPTNIMLLSAGILLAFGCGLYGGIHAIRGDVVAAAKPMPKPRSIPAAPMAPIRPAVIEAVKDAASLVPAWNELADLKGKLSEKEWKRRAHELDCRQKPYMDANQRKRIRLWEDPDSKIAFGLPVGRRSSPEMLDDFFSNQKDPVSAYKMCAGYNVLGDPVNNADYFLGLKNVPDEAHAEIMDLAVQRMISMEKTTLAAAWLAEHADLPYLDAARQSTAVALKNSDESVALANSIQNPGIRAVCLAQITANRSTP